MSRKYLRIPAARFEADRRLLREIFIFLPLNNRHVRLRQKGQHFEQSILDNYRSKGHSEFLIDATDLTSPDPLTIDLFEAGYVGENNVVAFQPGKILEKPSPNPPPEEGTVLPFIRKESPISEESPSEESADPASGQLLEQQQHTEGASDPDGNPPEGGELPPLSNEADNAPTPVGGTPADPAEQDLSLISQPAPSDISESAATKPEAPKEEPETAEVAQMNTPEEARADAATGDDPEDLSEPVTMEQKLDRAKKSRDKAENIREEKKKFFAERMRQVRAQQEKERAEREEKRIKAQTEKQEKENRIRAARALREAEERFDQEADKALEKMRIRGGGTDEDAKSFSGRGEPETTNKVSGGSSEDDVKRKFSAEQEEQETESRFSGAPPSPKESRFLSPTKELDVAMDKLKEAFISGKLSGKEDDLVLNLANMDPEVDRLLESAIVSNEIGKKMVLLGMQLESVMERARGGSTLTREDREANESFRARLVDRMEVLGKKLDAVKSGERVEGELRSDLNVDLLKEEIVDAIRAGKTGLEKIVTLAESVDDIKAGLVKTEALILQKEVARLVAEADPEKGKDFVRVIRAEAPDQYDAGAPETVVRAMKQSLEDAEEKFRHLARDDAEFGSAVDTVSKRLASSYVNEVSVYTAQLALALGYSNRDFIRELVMAALVCSGSGAVTPVKAPKFTRLVLEKIESRTELDSVTFDAVQIIELVRRIVKQENFRGGSNRLEAGVAGSVLAEAFQEHTLFASAFLERSRQYIETGVKLADASYSYQLSREAIVALKSVVAS